MKSTVKRIGIGLGTLSIAIALSFAFINSDASNNSQEINKVYAEYASLASNPDFDGAKCGEGKCGSGEAKETKKETKENTTETEEKKESEETKKSNKKESKKESKHESKCGQGKCGIE